MSDFLVNLARRSAGLAPVVHARSAPPIIASDFADESGERIVDHDARPATTVTVVRNVSPPAPDAITLRPHPTTIAPIQSTQTAASIAQRTPVASQESPAVAASVPSENGPNIVLPGQPLIPRDSTVVANPPAAIPTASHGESPDEMPRPVVPNAEHQIIETTIDLKHRHESRDESDPVVVSIKPAPQAITTPPATRVESAEERSVYVRIGAIEIVGPDNSAQSPVSNAASVPASAAVPAAAPGGFDEYRALRSYSPSVW